MKRNIFILGILCLLYACNTSEIIKYGERPRINFENTSKLNITVQHYVYFTDEDYLNGVTQKSDSLKLELMGEASAEALKCCFKLINEQNAPDITFPEYVELPAGAYETYVVVKVKRPERTDSRFVVTLGIDTENPLHDFDLGKCEGQQLEIVGEFRLKPVGWNNYFGAYSDGKYCFMLDFFKGTYGSIGNTSNNRALVREAYKEYRLTNPAILDEEGNEIIFP